MPINRNTGEVAVGVEHLGPALGEREFLDSTLGNAAKQIGQTGFRNFYEIWLSDASERDVGIVLSFSPSGRLRQLTLKFVKPEVHAAGWGGWSKAIEDEMKAFHDDWLGQRLGQPPFDFPWGSVASIIDLHGYSAVIIVDYARKQVS